MQDKSKPTKTKLGEGTFGIVYATQSPESGRALALKRNLVETETSFTGVPRETDILNKIRGYPHLIELQKIIFNDFFEPQGWFSPLDCKLHNTQRNDSIHYAFNHGSYDLAVVLHYHPLDIALMKRYMVHLLLGLERLHAMKIIHRDLKPANMVIFVKEKDFTGRPGVLKIADFGLAKPYTYQGNNTPKVCTAWYRAPEIALGYPYYDYASDVWAAGCILYEMIARRAFIKDAKDDDNDVLSKILNQLPQMVPVHRVRELTRMWRADCHINATNFFPRSSWDQQLNMTGENRKIFEAQAGDFAGFADLLDHMLSFEWNQRYTATQCLDHPFFADYTPLIVKMRETYPVLIPPEEKMTIQVCVERRWMRDLAIKIFNERGSNPWYTHRAMFHALDTFDRYLTAMTMANPPPENAVESELKGLIHTKHEVELRFITTLHLYVKYFMSLHWPVSYQRMTMAKCITDASKLGSGPALFSPESVAISEQFEMSMIRYCLGFNLYRPTIYESADNFNDKLDDTNIRDLVMFYVMNESFSGLTPTEMYTYYREVLRGHDWNRLSEPINLELLRKVRPVPLMQKQTPAPTTYSRKPYVPQIPIFS